MNTPQLPINEPNYAERLKAQNDCVQAIYDMKARNLKEGLIHAATGFGKTTIYLNITKTNKAPSLINVSHGTAKDNLMNELKIEHPKHFIDITSSNPNILIDQINSINKDSILLSTYSMLNRLHKNNRPLFDALFDKLGSFDDMCYVHSDEAHRGIGRQTIGAMQDISGEMFLELEADENSQIDEDSQIEEEYENNIHDAITQRNICHLLWTATPTYSHKSVKNHFETIFHYTKQQTLENGICVPLQNIHIGQGIQYVSNDSYTESDLLNGYEQYFILKTWTDESGQQHKEKVVASDMIIDKVAELHMIEPIKGIGACANIQHMNEIQKKYEQAGMRAYPLHGGNKKFRPQGSMAEAKKLMENGDIDIILVCNMGIELLNIPMLNSGIMHYSVISPVKLDQFIGRFTRQHPSKKVANFFCPPTKIVYAPQQEHTKEENTIEIVPRMSQTIGRLNWEDAYYNLGDFSIEYLEQHGLTYVRAYKNYLDGQKSKREMIETYQLHLVDMLLSKMNFNKFQGISKKMLIEVLELADIKTIDNRFRSLGELLTINKIIFTETNLRLGGFQKTTSNRNKFTVSDLKDHIMGYTNNTYLDSYEWNNIESSIIDGYVEDLSQKRDIYIKENNIYTPTINTKGLTLIKYYLTNKKLFLDFINQTDIRDSVHGLITIALPYIVYTAAKFDDFVLQKSNVRHIEQSDLVAYCIECLHEDIPLYSNTKQTKYTEWIITKITEYMITFFSSHSLEGGDSSEIEGGIKHIHSKSPELKHIDKETVDDKSYNLDKILALKSLFNRDFEARNEFSSVLKDIQHEDMNKEINDSLETLTPREGTVIQMYFGLNEYHPHSFEELAIEFKCSKSNIGQVLSKAIRRLKHSSRSKHFAKWLENRVDKNYIDPDTKPKYKLYISKFSSRSSFSDDSIIIRDDYLIDDY